MNGFIKLSFNKKQLRHLMFAMPLLLALSACQKSVDLDREEFQVPVRVAQVGLGTVEDRLVTGGSLRATQVATLTVETAGRITIGIGENGGFDEGARVQAGDVLGAVSGENLKLSVKRAVVEQRLESARSNLAISQKLMANRLTTVADHNHLKDVLEEAKLEYQRSLNTQAQSQIKSPISGVILRYFRDENGQRMANGQRVDVGDEVAMVAPLDTLIADIHLVSRDITRVSVGIPARIRSDIWPNKVFEGEVLLLAPVVDDATRTLQAQVHVDNREACSSRERWWRPVWCWRAKTIRRWCPRPQSPSGEGGKSYLCKMACGWSCAR